MYSELKSCVEHSITKATHINSAISLLFAFYSWQSPTLQWKKSKEKLTNCLLVPLSVSMRVNVCACMCFCLTVFESDFQDNINRVHSKWHRKMHCQKWAECQCLVNIERENSQTTKQQQRKSLRSKNTWINKVEIFLLKMEMYWESHSFNAKQIFWFIVKLL